MTGCPWASAKRSIAFRAIGRMNEGMRSTRASASALHATPTIVSPLWSLSIAPKGHPRPIASAGVGGSPSKASARAPAIDDVMCWKGCAGSDAPPTFTPRLFTICVSNGLVSIATRNPHSGQRKVTVSEPSSGPAVEWSFMGSSQSRHRNFMRAF